MLGSSNKKELKVSRSSSYVRRAEKYKLPGGGGGRMGAWGTAWKDVVSLSQKDHSGPHSNSRVWSL